MQQADKVVTAASPDDRAEEGRIAALPPREASTTLPQTGGLAQLHAINKLDLTNLQPSEVSVIAAPWHSDCTHLQTVHHKKNPVIPHCNHHTRLCPDALTFWPEQNISLSSTAGASDNSNYSHLNVCQPCMMFN